MHISGDCPVKRCLHPALLHIDMYRPRLVRSLHLQQAALLSSTLLSFSIFGPLTTTLFYPSHSLPTATSLIEAGTCLSFLQLAVPYLLDASHSCQYHLNIRYITLYHVFLQACCSRSPSRLPFNRLRPWQGFWHCCWRCIVCFLPNLNLRDTILTHPKSSRLHHQLRLLSQPSRHARLGCP